MRLYSNRIANLFANKFNLRKGDCVAILMENRPEYIGIWIGLAKIGVISALINTNLKNQQLMHTFENAKPKFVIYSAELEPGTYLQITNFSTHNIDLSNNVFVLAIKTVKTELNGSLKVISENELNELVKQMPDDDIIPNEKVLPQGKFETVMLIFLD